MYINREIEEYIKESSKSFQAIAIYGARQVGKSTTAKYIFDTFNHVSLDDIDMLTQAINNPKEFLLANKWPLIIDEVQRAPLLLNEIKLMIDNQRLVWLKNNEERQLMYVLTGSNQFELQQGIVESLAGRVAILNMPSLTISEIEKRKGSLFNPDINYLINKVKEKDIKYKNQKQIFNIIFNGSMPDIVAKNSERNLYYKSYIDTYINRDVSKLISSSSETQFRKFLTYIALRTSQVVNYEVFGRELGIDSQTIKRWISILVTSGIIILLEPYMSNISKRIIKASKLYFLDTGLCSYLCKWQDSEMLKNGVMSGAFFETFVVSEIIKSFFNHNIDYKNQLYYYRDIDQKEIDLLYVDNTSIYPIEIKKNMAPIKPDKNFNVLSKFKKEIKPGLIIDNIDQIKPLNTKTYLFPVSFIGL